MVTALAMSAVHFAVTVLSATALLAFVFRRPPVPVIKSFFVGLRKNPGMRSVTGAFVLLVAAHVFLVVIQNKFSFGGFCRMTSGLSVLEARTHEFAFGIPSFLNYVFCFAYFFLFPALPLVLCPVLDFTNRCGEYIDFFVAMDLCLAACLVFYVLFEANEVWTEFPGVPLFSRGGLHTALLNMRSMNHPGNCFPSLHVTLMAITCHAAFRHGMPRLVIVVVPLAFLVVLSTVCLVVHWYADVAAGTALGLACSFAARYLELGGADRASAVEE